MADDALRVRKTITVHIEGPDELVSAITTDVLTTLPLEISNAGKGQIRWRLQAQTNFLDDQWQVISDVAIMDAIHQSRDHNQQHGASNNAASKASQTRRTRRVGPPDVSRRRYSKRHP